MSSLVRVLFVLSFLSSDLVWEFLSETSTDCIRFILLGKIDKDDCDCIRFILLGTIAKVEDDCCYPLVGNRIDLRLVIDFRLILSSFSKVTSLGKIVSTIFLLRSNSFSILLRNTTSEMSPNSILTREMLSFRQLSNLDCYSGVLISRFGQSTKKSSHTFMFFAVLFKIEIKPLYVIEVPFKISFFIELLA